MQTILFQILLLLSVTATLLKCQDEEEIDTYSIITEKEKPILEMFKERVKSHLPHDYMKDDLYLIAWLRARELDIYGAEILLLDNLRWRKENDIDNILKEDWSDFEREYKVNLEGCDKAGRPVISIPVGSWDVRKAMLSGKMNRMTRYFDKLHEEMTTTIRNSRMRGENITQWNELYDMSNYNVISQACFRCIPIYGYWFNTYENHYPMQTHRITVVNLPQIAVRVWNILRGFLSPHTLEFTSLYGVNKKQWQMELLSHVNATQLTQLYGGVKHNPISLEEFRNGGGFFNCTSYRHQEDKL